jgi:hypothetical protein
MKVGQSGPAKDNIYVNNALVLFDVDVMPPVRVLF